MSFAALLVVEGILAGAVVATNGVDVRAAMTILASGWRTGPSPIRFASERSKNANVLAQLLRGLSWF